MALLDKQYTDRMYSGVLRMTTSLRKDEHRVIGKDHVRTLLRRMGIMALFPTREKPKIFNSDQGWQFTSESFTRRLLDENVRISMDSRGQDYDNIFVEQLWWSVEYEDIYLHEYQDTPDCKGGLDRYFRFYNTEQRNRAAALEEVSKQN